MPIGPARMPLFDHLGELRRRLTIVVVSVFAAAIVLYFATPVVLDILEDPIRSFVPDGKFYITTTLGGFGLRFSLAIKMAVVMCTPMIIWQILAFSCRHCVPTSANGSCPRCSPRRCCSSWVPSSATSSSFLRALVAHRRDLGRRNRAARSGELRQHGAALYDRLWCGV